MSKARSMYAGSSGSNYGVNKNSPGNGNGKWQGLWPSVGHARNTRHINIEAGGNNRNVVFCMNQLGGVGRISNMFATTADGVKECKHNNQVIKHGTTYTPPGGGLTSSSGELTSSSGELTSSSGGNVVLPFYVSLQLFSDPDNLPPWTALNINPIFQAQYSVDVKGSNFNNTNAYGTIEPYDATACFKTPGNSCSQNNATLCHNLVIGGCNAQSSFPFIPLSRPYNDNLIYYDRSGLCWPGNVNTSGVKTANPLYSDPSNSFEHHLISFSMYIDEDKAKEEYKDYDLGPFTYDNDNKKYPVVQMFYDTQKSASGKDFKYISGDYLTDEKILDEDNGVKASKLYYVDTSEIDPDTQKYVLKESGILISASVWNYKE